MHTKSPAMPDQQDEGLDIAAATNRQPDRSYSSLRNPQGNFIWNPIWEILVVGMASSHNKQHISYLRAA